MADDKQHPLARRTFLTTGIVGGASILAAAQSKPMISTLAALPQAGAAPAEKPAAPTGALRMSFACGQYDRMWPLFSGEVRPEGIDLNCIPIENPREVFDRMGRGEFDVSEFGATEFVIRMSSGKCPFVAIPVFPSRAFRHGFITVHRRANIRTAKDFDGKRIGVPLYRQAAALYIRGLLQHEYGVKLESIRWVQGAVNAPGSHGAPEALPLIRNISLEQNQSGKSLNAMLEEGSLDAIIGATRPVSLGRNPDVVRFFPDFAQAEREYYKRTHIFPIMHLIAIRRELYERNPFVATSLFNAMTRAKQLMATRMHNEEALPYMMPWMATQIEELDGLFGTDLWPYGLEANRPSLEAMMSYLVEQGFIPAPLPWDKLFVPVYGAR